MSFDSKSVRASLDMIPRSEDLEFLNYIPLDKSTIPHTKTYEEILKFTNDATLHIQNNSQHDSLNPRDKTTTRIVATVGVLLLVLSLILVGVSLSLSEYIDKLVRERHKLRNLFSLNSPTNSTLSSEDANNQSSFNGKIA